MTSDLTATLEALDWAIALCDFEKRREYGASLQSLRDRLDAAEPVAQLCIDGGYRCLMCDDDTALNALPHGANLYTAPPPPSISESALREALKDTMFAAADEDSDLDLRGFVVGWNAALRKLGVDVRND